VSLQSRQPVTASTQEASKASIDTAQIQVPAADPGVKTPQPATCHVLQQNQALSTSQRLWNTAYDNLEKDDDTAELVRSYVKVLDKVLNTKKASDSSASGTDDVSAELKDPAKRETYMRDLVKEGQAKVSTALKIKKAVGNVAEFVLSSKDMIGTAIQNIPQAALPWAGVCVGLQVSTNPSYFTSLFSVSTDVCLDPLESCKSGKIQSCRHYSCYF
jgi:hypothetical protein